jgi:cephalosporin-C deacetylase-like acetyl esterase
MDGAELVEVLPNATQTNNYHFFAAKIPCFGPRPVTGWLIYPKNATSGSLSIKAKFDGYSVAIAQPSVPYWEATAGTMLFHVNAHGYDMVGQDAQYYKDFIQTVNSPYYTPSHGKPYSHGLGVPDYDNPTNTYFYFMALRAARAFDYLKSRSEWNGRDVVAEGGSQGGLQTMWAGSLVDGISKIRPYITWGCDIGNSLNAAGPFLSNEWGIPNVPGAYYFDAALHAKRVPRTCVAEITRVGLSDYTSPPRGVLLSYYNLKCKASAKLVQGSDHSDSSVPPGTNQVFTISKEAVSVSSTSDFYWTGGANDGLWSSLDNWAMDADGTVPATQVPVRGLKPTCHFDVPAGGLTVTQDYKTGVSTTTGVVLSNLVVTTSAAGPVEFKIVSSEETAILDFTAGASITVADGATLTLNTYPYNGTTRQNLSKNGAGVLAIDFKKEPQASRPLTVKEGKAVVLATSKNPRFAVKVSGSDPANPPLFENLLPDALYEDISTSTLGGVKLNDTRAKISDMPENPAASTSLAATAVPSVLDSGTLYYGNEHMAIVNGSTFGADLELDRADVAAPNDVLVSLPFDDEANPKEDNIGQGGRLASIGTPSVVFDGERGNVLSLDGSSGFKGPDAGTWLNGFAPKKGFTVAFWLKPDASADVKSKILFWGTMNSGTCSALRMHDANGKGLFFNITSSGSDPCYIPVTNLRDGAWHHLAIVYNGRQNSQETFLVYYDGSLVHQAVFTGVTYNPTAKDFYFGSINGSGWGTSPNYKGLMDDFLLASRALSAEEIASVKAQGAASIAALLNLNGFVASSAGVLSVGRPGATVKTLSGTALAGGVEMTKPGSTLTVGAGAGETATEFQGAIAGTDSTLVKAGGDYALTLKGTVKGVTNVVVDAGTLAFGKPLASAIAELPEPVARWTFDGENPLADTTGNAALTLSSYSTNGTYDAAVSFETGDNICGGAVRFTPSGANNGCLRLETFPEGVIPVGDTSFTVIARYRPDTRQLGNVGAPCIVGWGATDMANGKLFRLGTDPDYGNSSVSVRAIIKGSNATISHKDTLRTKLGNDRTRWFVAAFVYRKGGECRLYSDGAFANKITGRVFALTPEMFSVGSSWIGNKDYSGLIDDIQVYNCALTDEQVRMRTEQLEASRGAAATSAPVPAGVLFGAPDVTVAQGATLDVASVENVGNLSGAGSVSIAANARLNVTSSGGFTGAISGDGYVGFADDVELEFGDGSSPLVVVDHPMALGANVAVNTTIRSGRRIIAHAASFVGAENLESWTATVNGRRCRFVVSGGTDLYLVVNSGMAIILQ